MEIGNKFAYDAEIAYAGEVPLTPNVRPVIVVCGSDYDMGYQWYQQIVQIYGKAPLTERAHRKYTVEQLASLKAYNWYIKRYTPEMVEMLRGMVAGAKDSGIILTYAQMLGKWCEIKHYSAFPSQYEDEDLGGGEDCSGFAAWGTATRNSQLICGGCGDHQIIIGGGKVDHPTRDAEFHGFEYVVALFPEKGNNFIISPATGSAWHPGMNDKGLAYVHHGAGAYTRPAQDYGYGIPSYMMTMHLLRFADNASKAKEMLISLPSADRGMGGLWADTKANAFCIEKRENPLVIRKAGDHGEVDFIYATNNLLSKQLSQYRGGGSTYILHGGWLGATSNSAISSVSRNLQLWNMLHYYHGKIDLDFVKMMWRLPGNQPSYPTLEEADAAFRKTQGKGWHVAIASLANAMVGILIPDDGANGLYYVSQGSLAKTTSPHAAGEHYYRIAPTYSFYQLKLDCDPIRLVQAARAKAQYDQYYAHLELAKLNYRDYAYAPLDMIFNQSAIEWQKGEYYYRLASKTAGNASINWWAKATRSFTRCQALARQVYNALIPPAASPEDLGLPSWG